MGGGREIALAAPPPPFNSLESWGERVSVEDQLWLL